MNEIGEVASFSPVSKADVGADAIEAFKRDGVVVLRDAFDSKWLEEIESAIPRLLERGGINGVNIKADPADPGFFFYDFMMWQEVESFRRFTFDSHAPDLYRSLLHNQQAGLLLRFFDHQESALR